MTKEQPRQTLDKTYRPQTFDEVWGNEGTLEAIKVAINRADSFPSCTLLWGPSGCGKTTLARIIAYELEAFNRDLKQYNISEMRGIDAARSIMELIKVAPWGKRRVIILNECHKATNEFQNSMLEVLEEPPPYNHFILCTTEPNKLLPTIRTRATKYMVESLATGVLEQLVQGVLDAEQVTMDGNVIRELAKAAKGSPREALLLLDNVIDLNGSDKQLAMINTRMATEYSVIELYTALMERQAWKTIANIIPKISDQDPEGARYIIMKCLENDLLKGGKRADRAAAMMDFFSSSFYSAGRPALTQACWFALKI